MAILIWPDRQPSLYCTHTQRARSSFKSVHNYPFIYPNTQKNKIKTKYNSSKRKIFLVKKNQLQIPSFSHHITKKAVKCHFWISRNWNFFLNIFFLKMVIIRINWKIKLNYLPAQIKAVHPSLAWRSMFAPFSNNIWTISLCPFLAEKTKIKSYTKQRKKESKVFKINVFNIGTR